MTERQLIYRLQKDARRISRHFKLRCLGVTTEHPEIQDRWGSCDEDKVIRIRLHNLRTGKFLPYSLLSHTLCHEMAHLRFMDHGRNFKDLNDRILNWAREKGIYWPLNASGGQKA